MGKILVFPVVRNHVLWQNSVCLFVCSSLFQRHVINEDRLLVQRHSLLFLFLMTLRLVLILVYSRYWPTLLCRVPFRCSPTGQTLLFQLFQIQRPMESFLVCRIQSWRNPRGIFNSVVVGNAPRLKILCIKAACEESKCTERLDPRRGSISLALKWRKAAGRMT